MLLFLGGSLWSVLVQRWWAALGCALGFIVAAFIIRRVSTVEPQQASSDDSIVFL
jgi:uncharacterized protein involved in exopolysaccharide biosynthesis